MTLLERLLNLAPFVAAFALVGWLYGKARHRTTRDSGEPAALNPESFYTVVVSENQLAVELPDGSVEHVALEDLAEIRITTNSLGPWLPDVWWEFYAQGKMRCRFPQGATGEQGAIDFVGKLSGFNFETFIQAMASTSDAVFVCWKRAA